VSELWLSVWPSLPPGAYLRGPARPAPFPLEEIVGKVEAVTVESARAAARALVSRSRPAVAVLGPGRGLERAAVIAESLGRRA